MKIAVSGAQATGKTTFVQDFIQQWPMYKKPAKTYRDIIEEKKLSLNQLGNKESQEIILNALVEEVTNNTGEHLIFDRCPLDNLIFTMWLSAKEKVEDSFVKKTIEIVRESLVFYDIIFFTPITKYSPVIVDVAQHRDIDPGYRDEIDVLFKSIMHAYTQHSTVFFPFKHELGCPAIIEIFGKREERIQLAKMYINEKGNIFSEDDSLMNQSLSAEPYSDEEKALMAKAFGIR